MIFYLRRRMIILMKRNPVNILQVINHFDPIKIRNWYDKINKIETKNFGTNRRTLFY